MKFANVLAALLATVITPTLADLTQYAKDLPQCGLTCLLDVISKSPCTLSNETCICSNEELVVATQLCLTQNCTVLESLQVLKISNLSCGKPIESRSTHIISTSAMAGVTFLAIILRMISRWDQRSFKSDDYLMLVIFFLLIPFTTLGMLSAAHGFGRNIWDIPAHDLVIALKTFFLSQSVYIVILGLSKMSMIVFYLRIFPSQTFKRISIAILVWIALTMVLLLFLTVFQCWPLEYNWEGWKGDFGPHKCRDVFIQANAHGIINIAQDFAVLILPLPWLFRLKVGIRKKVNIILLFSLGIFICITSILRLVNLAKFRETANPTWDYTDTIFWSALETYMGVLIPNLPAIRALLSRKLPRVFGTETAASNYRNQYEQSQPPRPNQSYEMTLTSTKVGSEKADYFQNERLELGDRLKGNVITGVTTGKTSDEIYVGKDNVIVTTKTMVEGRVCTPNSERTWGHSLTLSESQDKIIK